MNFKFVWQSFIDLRWYFFGIGVIVAAGLTGVSFLIWLSLLVFFGICLSYFEPLRASVGPARGYYRAARFGRKARFAEAIETATTYLQEHPRDGRAHETRALGLLGLGRYDEALAEADRAVSWKRRWQSLMIRGQILYFLGCPVDALRDLEPSYRMREHGFTRFLMASSHTSLRNLATAVSLFRRSTASVNHSITYLGLAESLRLLSRTVEAQPVYRKVEMKARRETRAGVPTGSILAYALAQLSRDREADDAADAALQRNGRDTVAIGTQALMNLRRGEMELAEEKLRQMLLINPPSLIGALAEPQFSHLLAERRFRELFAWAVGAQRQVVERVRRRQNPEPLHPVS